MESVLIDLVLEGSQHVMVLLKGFFAVIFDWYVELLKYLSFILPPDEDVHDDDANAQKFCDDHSCGPEWNEE